MYVFHVCFDLCFVCSVGICVDICGVISVLEYCLFLKFGCCLLCILVSVWSVVIVVLSVMRVAIRLWVMCVFRRVDVVFWLLLSTHLQF